MSPSPENPIVLHPSERGYVAVETESGSISCLVQPDWIGCETPATNWPRKSDGFPHHSLKLYTDGSIEWVDGQMGDLERTKVDHREYRVLGWAVVAIDGGLRLTNERTGHGASVTTSEVVAF